MPTMSSISVAYLTQSRLWPKNTLQDTSDLRKTSFSATSSAPGAYPLSANDNAWSAVIKPRLDSMPMDEEYRAYTESFIKGLPTDFAIKVLDNMERILELPQESVADAKQFHLADLAEYREWYSGWCDDLENWLANDNSVSPEGKEQAQMALNMLREFQAAQPGGVLTTDDIIESGNAYTQVSQEAIKDSAGEAFSDELFSALGLTPPASPEQVFSAVFGKGEGAASFVKGMYNSRYGVGVSVNSQGEAAFFSGAKPTRPGAIPSHLQEVDREIGEALGTVHDLRTGYSYSYDSKSGEFSGPQYNNGYSVLNAAYLEAMGWSVELDHNKVPMATAFELNNRPYDVSWGLDASNYRESESLPEYYAPNRGMNAYEFQTNRQAKNSLAMAIEAFIKNTPRDSADSEKTAEFIAKIKSFIEKSFATDDTDVFANNSARNWSPEKSALANLENNYSSAHEWLSNR